MRKCRLMVVEDEFAIRQGILNLVDWEQNGFLIVAEASDGQDAIGKMERCRPDIVLTDIKMPRMDGIRLIEEIGARFPAVKLVVLSGHGDYDYVRSAFRNGAADYMLKPTLNPADLLAMLNKLARDIPGVVLSDHESRTAGHKVKALIGSLGEPDLPAIREGFSKPCFVLMGMSDSFLEQEGLSAREGERRLRELARDCCKAWEFAVFSLNRQIIFLLNLLPEEYGEGVAALETLADRFRAVCKDAFFVYSDLVLRVNDIKRVYDEQISDNLTRRFYDRGRFFLYYGRLVHPPATAAIIDERAFLELLETGRAVQAALLLSEQLARAAHQRAVREEKLKSISQSAVYTLLQSMERYGIKPELLAEHKRGLIVAISHARYAEDFLSVMDELVHTVAGLTPENRDMDEILAYIQENYAQKITLSDLAQRFNFSYSYLSSYFTSRYNENFNEYLNRVRIQQAKRLLCDRDIPISEVGSRTGYVDNSYFARVFKKMLHMSPSKYRQMMLRDQL